jgi:hypothetical protein
MEVLATEDEKLAALNAQIAEICKPKTLNEVLDEYDDEKREEDPDYRSYNEMAL